jgi:hypothetical protein
VVQLALQALVVGMTFEEPQVPKVGMSAVAAAVAALHQRKSADWIQLADKLVVGELMERMIAPAQVAEAAGQNSSVAHYLEHYAGIPVEQVAKADTTVGTSEEKVPQYYIAVAVLLLVERNSGNSLVVVHWMMLVEHSALAVQG